MAADDIAFAVPDEASACDGGGSTGAALSEEGRLDGLEEAPVADT